ncbi:MAG: type II toxin-antitoxin system VapB family antitoxin [Solirubrobacteraceae bacterium]
MRTNIDIDDRVLHEAQQLIGARTKRETVDVDRRARRAGVTIGKTLDCLIAAPCVRTGAPLLHADADFDKLAECTPLRLYS